MAVKIYTKTGDQGETSLVNGTRTSKDSLRVEAFGAIDEVSSFLGLCVVKLAQEDIKLHLMDIQRDLLTVGSNLAFPQDLSQSSIRGESVANKIPKITETTITKLEQRIDEYEKELPELKNFILCGGTETSALLHVARNVCRRAERQIVSLKKTEEVDKNVLRYINRLSDYLFTAARLVTKREGKEDTKWINL